MRLTVDSRTAEFIRIALVEGAARYPELAHFLPRSMRRAVVVLLLAATQGAPLRAQDATATAEAAARASAATDAGKQYEESIGAAFGREHPKTVGACAKSHRRDLGDFDLLVRVGAGVADEVLAKPANPFSDCVRAKLVGWRVAPPPDPPRWVRIAVKLKRP